MSFDHSSEKKSFFKRGPVVFLMFVLGYTYLMGMVILFYLLQPVQKNTTVLIPKGSNLKQVARILDQENLILHPLLFEWTCRLLKKDKMIKAGEYEFEEGLLPLQVIDKMVRGDMVVHTLVIPEGFNLKQIRNLMRSKNLAGDERWEETIRNTGFIKSVAQKAETIEGYVFPDTYNFNRTISSEDIIHEALLRFKSQAKPHLIDRARDAGFDIHQWVTLASIIEKETGIERERPIIARVFLNRLKINMPLQTDPTVIYGVENFDGNLTREHLKTDHPYNTYTRTGLPPGPICSPGLESLMAVLEPAEGNYLYFVSKGDGSHFFSVNYEEHQHAVQYYQLHQGEAPVQR